MKVSELEFGKSYYIDKCETIGVFTKGNPRNGFKIVENNSFIPYGENKEGLVCFRNIKGEDEFDYKEVKK